MSGENLFLGAFWFLLAAVFIMRMYFSVKVRRAGERIMPDREAVRREGVGLFALRAVSFFCLLAWLVVFAIHPPWMDFLSVSLPGWLRWAGFGVGLASLGFWWWTQVVLDRQWSAQLQLRQDHRLVTWGPYKHIRHPLYTAMFGYAGSLALVTANWVFIVFALLTFLAMLLRVPREEKMMLAEFGEEYQAYMHTTGRFLPK